MPALFFSAWNEIFLGRFFCQLVGDFFYIFWVVLELNFCLLFTLIFESFLTAFLLVFLFNFLLKLASISLKNGESFFSNFFLSHSHSSQLTWSFYSIVDLKISFEFNMKNLLIDLCSEESVIYWWVINRDYFGFISLIFWEKNAWEVGLFRG